MQTLRSIEYLIITTLLLTSGLCGAVTVEPSADIGPDEALFRVVWVAGWDGDKGDINAVREALRNGANPNAMVKHDGQTVLSAAVSHMWPEAVEVLLKAGADPNFCPQPVNGSATNCPLTSLYGETIPPDNEGDIKKEKIVKLLLNAGADPDGKSLDDNPLAVALIVGKPNIAEMLLAAGANPHGTKDHTTPLWAAFASGQTAFAKKLIRAGARLKPGIDPAKDAALFVKAAENRDAEAIALLLQLGFDPNLPNQCRVLDHCFFGTSNPLVIATAKDCTECVKRLLSAGARCVLKDENGDSAPDDEPDWFGAIGIAGPETLATYWTHGLNLHVKNRHKQTLLHVAAAGDKPGAISWLVKHGIDVNVTDEENRTALMFAAANGRIDMVQALLDAKADVSIHDGTGLTAKIIANGSNSSERVREFRLSFAPNEPTKNAAIVRLLESYGAAEYAGDDLPSSNFDSELINRDQRDVTGHLYQHLPFLRSGLRFFAAFKNTKTPPSPSVPTPLFILFGVLPGNHVIKLVDAHDLSTNIGMRLRSQKDALALVRFVSGDVNFDSRFFHVDFNGTELAELWRPGPCSSYPPKPYSAAGITQPKVRALNGKGREKYFVVTRFMMPRSLREADVSGEITIPNVTRVSERVTMDGSYSMEGMTIATPGLTVSQCGEP